MGSAVLMEIPIAMIVACRLLPFRANRLANIIAGGIVTLINGFLTFVPPLVGWRRPPAFPEYLFFATIETVCTSVIIWQAWTWSAVEAAVSSERIVGHPEPSYFTAIRQRGGWPLYSLHAAWLAANLKLLSGGFQACGRAQCESILSA